MLSRQAAAASFVASRHKNRKANGKTGESPLQPGDVVYRRGQPCTIVEICYDTVPPHCVVRTEAGNEVGTEIGLVSREKVDEPPATPPKPMKKVDQSGLDTLRRLPSRGSSCPPSSIDLAATQPASSNNTEEYVDDMMSTLPAAGSGTEKRRAALKRMRERRGERDREAAHERDEALHRLMSEGNDDWEEDRPRFQKAPVPERISYHHESYDMSDEANGCAVGSDLATDLAAMKAMEAQFEAMEAQLRNPSQRRQQPEVALTTREQTSDPAPPSSRPTGDNAANAEPKAEKQATAKKAVKKEIPRAGALASLAEARGWVPRTPSPEEPCCNTSKAQKKPAAKPAKPDTQQPEKDAELVEPAEQDAKPADQMNDAVESSASNREKTPDPLQIMMMKVMQDEKSPQRARWDREEKVKLAAANNPEAWKKTPSAPATSGSAPDASRSAPDAPQSATDASQIASHMNLFQSEEAKKKIEPAVQNDKVTDGPNGGFWEATFQCITGKRTDMAESSVDFVDRLGGTFPDLSHIKLDSSNENQKTASGPSTPRQTPKKQSQDEQRVEDLLPSSHVSGKLDSAIDCAPEKKAGDQSPTPEMVEVEVVMGSHCKHDQDAPGAGARMSSDVTSRMLSAGSTCAPSVNESPWWTASAASSPLGSASGLQNMESDRLSENAEAEDRIDSMDELIEDADTVPDMVGDHHEAMVAGRDSSCSGRASSLGSVRMTPDFFGNLRSPKSAQEMQQDMLREGVLTGVLTERADEWEVRETESPDLMRRMRPPSILSFGAFGSRPPSILEDAVLETDEEHERIADRVTVKTNQRYAEENQKAAGQATSKPNQQFLGYSDGGKLSLHSQKVVEEKAEQKNTQQKAGVEEQLRLEAEQAKAQAADAQRKVRELELRLQAEQAKAEAAEAQRKAQELEEKLKAMTAQSDERKINNAPLAVQVDGCNQAHDHNHSKDHEAQKQDHAKPVPLVAVTAEMDDEDDVDGPLLSVPVELGTVVEEIPKNEVTVEPAAQEASVEVLLCVDASSAAHVPLSLAHTPVDEWDDNAWDEFGKHLRLRQEPCRLEPLGIKILGFLAPALRGLIVETQLCGEDPAEPMRQEQFDATGVGKLWRRSLLGGTALWQHAVTNAQQLRPSGLKCVIMVASGADGRSEPAYCGDAGARRAADELLALGLPVHSVTLGAPKAESQCREVSSRTGGVFVSLPTVDEFKEGDDEHNTALNRLIQSLGNLPRRDGELDPQQYLDVAASNIQFAYRGHVRRLKRKKVLRFKAALRIAAAYSRWRLRRCLREAALEAKRWRRAAPVRAAEKARQDAVREVEEARAAKVLQSYWRARKITLWCQRIDKGARRLQGWFRRRKAREAARKWRKMQILKRQGAADPPPKPPSQWLKPEPEVKEEVEEEPKKQGFVLGKRPHEDWKVRQRDHLPSAMCPCPALRPPDRPRSRGEGTASMLPTGYAELPTGILPPTLPRETSLPSPRKLHQKIIDIASGGSSGQAPPSNRQDCTMQLPESSRTPRLPASPRHNSTSSFCRRVPMNRSGNQHRVGAGTAMPALGGRRAMDKAIF